MAASEINMSYSQAWQLINNLEKRIGFPLLIKKTGGEAGGGSFLTEKGEELIQKFEQFQKDAEKAFWQSFKKYFV